MELGCVLGRRFLVYHTDTQCRRSCAVEVGPLGDASYCVRMREDHLVGYTQTQSAALMSRHEGSSNLLSGISGGATDVCVYLSHVKPNSIVDRSDIPPFLPRRGRVTRRSPDLLPGGCEGEDQRFYTQGDPECVLFGTRLITGPGTSFQ